MSTVNLCGLLSQLRTGRYSVCHALHGTSLYTGEPASASGGSARPTSWYMTAVPSGLGMKTEPVCCLGSGESSSVAVIRSGLKMRPYDASDLGAISRSSEPVQYSFSMTGRRRHTLSVGFWIAGRSLAVLVRTGVLNSTDSCSGSCDTHTPVSVSESGSDPSMKIGMLSRRISSLTTEGWKAISKATSSCGLRNPSVGSTLKLGRNDDGVSFHLVPMSPAFSSTTLRYVFECATTAPKNTMSVSSFTSIPTAEPLRTRSTLEWPATSNTTFSVNGSIRLEGEK
mmetsp:Transcript_27009/g.71109  ORF Transcript_27009/g.71109 Transcript_27009/m.71109 type:complete len:283 (-) Transcript_27009:6517-7365(-)